MRHFGLDYGYESWTLVSTDPLPDDPAWLQKQATALAGLDPDQFVQLLASSYPPGSPPATSAPTGHWWPAMERARPPLSASNHSACTGWAHSDAGYGDHGRQRPAGRPGELHRRPTGHPEGDRQRPAAPGQLAGADGPMAPIVVATVYDPSDGTGDALRLGLPVWPEALALLAELNQALRSLAEEHRALVADVHGRLLGHGLAIGDPTQLDQRPSNRDLWYCGFDRAQRLGRQRDPGHLLGGPRDQR